MNNKPKKLLDQVREHIRMRHLSMSTEEAYCGWIRRYVLFHEKKYPFTGAAHGRSNRQARAGIEVPHRF